MWPWEHAVFAYLLYSIAHRAGGSRVSGRSVVGFLFLGSLLPDLIDKPLSWQWDVFETGYGLGHSLFFAIPLAIAVLLLAHHLNRLEDGVAFAFGYVSHLVADLVPRAIREGQVPTERVLWPIAEPAPSGVHDSFLDGARHYFARYLDAIATGEPDLLIVAQIGLALFTIGLWIADGYPGLR